MDDPYRPVACSFTDRLEDAAVRRTPLRVTWRDPSTGSGHAATREAVTTIADVMTEHGADWVRLGTGEVVRADRLMAVASHDWGDTVG
jgi:transcriptional antiterminator Rof (Rho-off)